MRWTATLDVKLKAPNGTNVTVKGKQGFDGVTTGSVRHASPCYRSSAFTYSPSPG